MLSQCCGVGDMQVSDGPLSIKSITTSDCSADIACMQWSNIVCCFVKLCKRNLPSQYKNHLFGLSGHNAGSFTATVFIVKSAVPGGVAIGSPAAASTWY